MILSPAVLALLSCSVLVCGIAVVALIAGLSAAVRWNPDDSGERQLARERRAYLAEVAMKVVLACELLSLFLFVAAVDHLHTLFDGAMCAAGTLNAGPLGYPALLATVACFLLCGVWLVVQHASAGVATSGLVRIRQFGLLLVVGALCTQTVLQTRFFASLDPEIVTSCCATIFGENARGIGAGVASLPVRESQVVFFVGIAVTLGVGSRAIGVGRSPTLFSFLSVVLGVVSLASIVIWVGPCFYRTPTHHCPFCLLSPRHGYVGYPLYVALAVAVVTGCGSGVVHALRSFDPGRGIRQLVERRLCQASIVSFVAFFLLAVWPMLISDFRPAAL